jgi:hypothetical protein
VIVYYNKQYIDDRKKKHRQAEKAPGGVCQRIPIYPFKFGMRVMACVSIFILYEIRRFIRYQRSKYSEVAYQKVG